LEHFEEFFKLLPEKATSERSWLIPIEEIKAKNFDLKAVNPNRKGIEDHRTPEELLSIIESQGEEIKRALMVLKNRMS
jgi:type I restriction enzyme M protein